MSLSPARLRALRRSLPGIVVTSLFILNLTPARSAPPVGDEFDGPSVGAAWTSVNIGDAEQAQASSTEILDGTLRLLTSGSDIGGTQDGFRFAYQTVTGDFTLTVQVLDTPSSNPNSKTGLMARQTTDPDSPMAYIGWTRDFGAAFLARTEAGASAGTFPSVGTKVLPPYWVRLERRGDWFTGSYSTDGKVWRNSFSWGSGHAAVPMKDPILVGAAVTANNAADNGVGRVDHLTAAEAPAGRGFARVNVTIKGETADDGSPLPANGAFVTAIRDSLPVGGGSVSDGSALLLDLPPGDLSLTAGARGFELATVPVTIAAGNVTESTVEIQRSSVIDLSSDALATAGNPNWSLLIPGDDSAIADPASGAGFAGSRDYAETPGDGQDGWIEAAVPGNWNDILTEPNQFAWYRLKLAKLPPAFPNNPVRMTGFAVDDVDEVFVNGTSIGATGRMPRFADPKVRDDPTGAGYATQATTPRSYMIPRGLLKGDGSDILAIRIFSAGNPGGLTTGAPKLEAFPGGEVSGSVTDASGKPVPNRTLKASSEGNTLFGPTEVTAQSRSDGTYVLSGLPEGTYTVTRLADPSVSPPGDDVKTGIAVRAGERVPLSFTATPLPTVEMTTANGFPWIIRLSEEVSETDDYRAPGASEEGFVPYVVTPGVSPWGKVDPTSRIYGWVRLRFSLPESFRAFQGSDLRLYDFTFEDVDTTYFNGEEIGKAGSYPRDKKLDPGFVSAWDKVRNYVIPASLVNWTGENVIAIRGYVRNSSATGGGFSQKSPPILGISKVVLPATPGDLNGDGRVNTQDATLSLRIAVGLIEPTPAQTRAGDVNGDGRLNIQDTTLILRVAVGLATF